MGTQRLSKVCAAAGVASRRACEALIAEGKVEVNGEVVLVPQHPVDLEKDRVKVEGRYLRGAEKKVYFLLHKPTGFICSSERPPSGGRIVLDLFGKMPYRLFTVGRLDKDTSGLLLVTNDGQFADQVIHPSSGITKEYLAKVREEVQEMHLTKLQGGAEVDGVYVRPVKVQKVRRGTLRITVSEGRKHEVRILVEKAGLTLKSLERIRLGSLVLGDLPQGAFRDVTEAEKEQLLEAAAEERAKPFRGRERRPRPPGERGERRWEPRGERPFPPQRQEGSDANGIRWQRHEGRDRPYEDRAPRREQSDRPSSGSWQGEGRPQYRQDRFGGGERREGGPQRRWEPRGGERPQQRWQGREGGAERRFPSRDTPRPQGEWPRGGDRGGDRGWSPRPGGDRGGDRGWSPRPGGDRGGDRGWSPRPGGDRGGDRGWSPRPGGDRGGDRGWSPRPGGDRGGDRGWSPRPGGDRGGDRGWSPRPGGDRGGDRGWSPRPGGDRGGDRGWSPRPGGERPVRSGAGNATQEGQPLPPRVWKEEQSD